LLRIRLSRVGKKKQPAYRLIVADSRAPREGAFLRIIGHYNPLTEPVTLVVKEDEAVYWLQKGAQPSDTAAKLLTRLGVMEKAGKQPVKYEGKQVESAAKKTKGEPKAEAAPAAAPAPAAEAAAPEPESAEAEPETAAEPVAETPEPETAGEEETPAEEPPDAGGDTESKE
jgi:small subunit ribosomal protein S16